MVTTYRFGTSYIPLLYTNEELKGIVELVIKSFSASFSFRQLCSAIINRADNEGKLKKEPHTQYSSVQLTTDDTNKISYLLWQIIWDKKLIIVFEPNTQYADNKDFHFVRVENIYSK